MATERKVVTTVPMFVTQHKAPAPPATAVKPPPPTGEDPLGTHGHPICSGTGGKH